MSEDVADIERELNSPGGATGYFKPNQIPVGQSQEITVVGRQKWTETKYPIKDKTGKDLGYTWRFRLSNGQVWDVSNANRKVLLRGIHPTDPKVIVPGRFRVTNKGQVVNKQPATQVEFLGAAAGFSPQAEHDGDVPF